MSAVIACRRGVGALLGVMLVAGCGGAASVRSTNTAPASIAAGAASVRSTKTARAPIATASAIDVASLKGRIVFTRAGGQYGDETIYTADADGAHERRISGFGQTCCIRWISGGAEILMPASSRDHRVTTGFFRPNGTLIRKLPLPGDGLNLGCAQAFSPVTGQLACEGWSDKHPALNGVYTVRASDGGDLRRLTRNPEHDISAGFSPNGSQILFFRPVDSFPSYGDTPEGSLYVVTSNGKSLHRVTPANMPVEAIGNAGGRLSPDGKWIAFTSSGVIWKIHPDGSGMTRVFDDRQGRLAITPTWSPDGTYILFGLDPRESLGTVQTAPANGLYVIRADGSGLAPVITSNDFKREPDWTGTS